MYHLDWPYPLEWDKEEVVQSDVLILGGGIAGCMAAIAAARQGMEVVLVEKGATKRSGAGGSGCDHWESAATNPCSKVTPEDLAKAMLDDNDGFNNGISHYIECREGYDRLLDIEKMGGKIRDTEDEFVGAEFRDDSSKLMFAYDYENKYTIRIWGSTFKPAMYNELKRLGVKIYDRTMVTALLTEDGKQGGRCIGATGIHTRTGKFFVFKSKASVMCMSRPARVWLFSAELPGLCEFRPTQCIGDGHAMGWRSGAEFTMMEKSVGAEFSASGRSYPPYGAGNNHNTWYAASLIDSNGREVPYADRDGNLLERVSDRFRPAKGQKFFMKGGNIENAKYEYDGPETLPLSKMAEEGYKLPFYADLSSLPEQERKVIWGMMIGEEGKTKIPIYKNYNDAGFDPKKHVIQCYGSGWTSASFLPQERQLFGLPGGFFNDWRLSTNLPGLYAAGDSLFASNCFGHAAATGYYAGRH
ncbi:MAG: FAD-dependent oxidoreductase, partial [Clostridia bacterium]|nr:FAD-dependent oxidoreductase [Clostridia bacterium]